ncbi:MAG: recombination-associated protein RdgC [Desulfobacterales bacterium]|nr:recombination-associated protein RdgC [Desulfobacterales bacterium]
MGLLSSSASITRYQVTGKLPEPMLENLRTALTQNAIREIDQEPMEKSAGWTSFESPFKPDFGNSPLVYGTHVIFSMRIDKKKVPAKALAKQVNLETAKRLHKSDRKTLSKAEKTQLKDEVLHRLLMRMPATPHIYDLVWNYEAQALWFFSNLKAANEEMEALFAKTFKLPIIRMFPYTMADMACGLTGSQRDALVNLARATK